FVDGDEYLGYGLLDNPVHYRGYAQQTFSPVLFGYHYPPYLVWAVFALEYGPNEFSPVINKIIFQRFDLHLVNTSGSLVAPYLQVGRVQVRRGYDELQQSVR